MRKLRWALAVLALAAAGLFSFSPAAQPGAGKKRLLLVTHSGGFIHPSVRTAEEVLKDVGPRNGFDVTCWRYTGETDSKALEDYGNKFRKATGLTVGPENCGRINRETLKNFDVVLFFTTGDPVNKAELADLVGWVKAGGAFAGTHCATDTLYKDTAYGELLGAYFQGHPPGLQKIKVKVEDPRHPAAAGFENGMDYQDEMYVFKDAPFSRERLHIILSIDPSSFKPAGKLARQDADYAISWCREEGKGKVFYTSFGHDPKVWKDERFQKHLFGGLRWATGQLPGDATPSGKK